MNLWLALVLAVPLGCAAREAARPSRSTAPLPEESCATAAMRIEVQAPGPGDARATFRFAWEGQGTGAASRVVCVVAGELTQLVPRGEGSSVAVRAHPRELQRIVVDGRVHLVRVPPGATIGLGDNPCFFYEMYGPSTDPWFVDPPLAYCSAPGEPCRDGYFRPSPPRPVEDALCGATDPDILRCAAMAEVRVVSAPGVMPLARAAEHVADVLPIASLVDGAPFYVAPRSCGFTAIATGTETGALVVGAGERWSLAVDAAGRLTGEAELR